VARGVGHDELAPAGGEEAVGDVDRDALLALGRQAVQQQREVEVAVVGAAGARVALQRRQLILEDQLRLPQQPADERALAVVDRAARYEPQQILALERVEAVGELLRGRAQKYPSCFLRSIEAAPS
jgi:hypothetical protein